MTTIAKHATRNDIEKMREQMEHDGTLTDTSAEMFALLLNSPNVIWPADEPDPPQPADAGHVYDDAEIERAIESSEDAIRRWRNENANDLMPIVLDSDLDDIAIVLSAIRQLRTERDNAVRERDAARAEVEARQQAFDLYLRLNERAAATSLSVLAHSTFEKIKRDGTAAVNDKYVEHYGVQELLKAGLIKQVGVHSGQHGETMNEYAPTDADAAPTGPERHVGYNRPSEGE